jgi:hypothetical protein
MNTDIFHGVHAKLKFSQTEIQDTFSNPHLEQLACGMISPKMTIRAVDIRKPVVPDVISPIRMASRELTATLPLI